MIKRSLFLIGLGLLACQVFASEESSFLFTANDLNEEMYYGRGALEVPHIFGPSFPLNIDPYRLQVVRGPGGFMVGIDVAYLWAFDNELDYAIVDPTIMFGNSGPIAPSPFAKIRTLAPQGTVAYSAEIGYAFPFWGTDLLLHVQGLSYKDSDKIDAPIDGVIWDNQSIYELSRFSTGASTSISYSLAQADLTLGNRIFAGTRFILHPYFGACYLDLTRKIDTTYSNAVSYLLGLPDFVGNAHVTQDSTFTGGGPRIGLDTEYLFTPNFGLVTHSNLSLYVGTINSKAQEETTLPPLPVFASARINQGKADRVVPAFEGKLGLALTFPCINTRIEAGYQATHYFDAFNTYRAGGSTVLFTYIKDVHDFTVYGPYLSINIYDLACPSDYVPEPFCVHDLKSLGGFEFGVGALTLRPNQNQLDFAIVDPRGLPPLFPVYLHPSVFSNVAKTNPGVSQGYQVLLGSNFRNSPYDFQAIYQYLRQTDKTIVEAPTGGEIWNVLSIVQDDITAPVWSTRTVADYTFTYNNVDINVGERIASSPQWKYRLFGGLRYSELNGQLETFYENLHDVLGATGFLQEGNVKQKSEVQAFGPRIGARLNYQWSENLALAAEGGMAILFGRQTTQYLDKEPANPLTGFLGLIHEENQNEDQIVPNLDAKVALVYNPSFLGSLNTIVELGYMVNHYFNAQTNFRPTRALGGAVKQVNDIDMNGFYLNIDVLGLGACPAECRNIFEVCERSPELIGGFEFAVEALYYRLHSTLMDYTIRDPNNPLLFDETVPGPQSEVLKIQPNNHAAYRYHLGYIFPMTANDVALEFEKFSTDETANAHAAPNGVLWTLLADPAIGVNSAPLIAEGASSAFSFDSHTVDLEYGRHIRIEKLNLRFLAGLSYLSADEQLKTTYSNVTSVTFTPVGDSQITDKDTFRGIGPRLGLDARFNIACGFGLTAHAATNFYVGQNHSEHVEVNSGGAIDIPGVFSNTLGFSTTLDPGKHERLVTNLELRGGLDFLVPLRGCTNFEFEIGYEVNHYFNLLDSYRFTNEYSQAFKKQENDISLFGPYVRIKLLL